jgi:hypothetical protein
MDKRTKKGTAHGYIDLFRGIPVGVRHLLAKGGLKLPFFSGGRSEQHGAKVVAAAGGGGGGRAWASSSGELRAVEMRCGAMASRTAPRVERWVAE